VVETLVVWSHEFERLFESSSYSFQFDAAMGAWCLVSGVRSVIPDTRHQTPDTS